MAEDVGQNQETARLDAAGELRADGTFINLLTGMGVAGRDKTLGTAMVRSPLLTNWEVEQLYLNGLPRRYIDAVADECYKHPATIELGQELQEEWAEFPPAFNEYLEGIEFAAKLSEVVRLQRLYGGAALVVLADDGKTAEEPVDYDNLRSIHDVVPLSRWEIIPEQFNLVDPSKPEFYRISTSQKLEPGQDVPFTFFRIHHTRVIRFDGLYLPWQIRVTNQGWGMSCMQLIASAYRRYQTVLKGLESMTADADMFVHKIPGLFNRIASGSEGDLKRRMEANTLSRSVYNGMLIDTEEDVNFVSRNLAGLSQATQPFLEELQTITGWPASYLTGVSPGGLGRDGRYEERNWAACVENWQKNQLRKPVNDLFTLCMQAKDSPSAGTIPEMWSVKFPSVFTKTDEEEANLRNIVSQSDVQYINMGVLSPLEVRKSRFGGTHFDPSTTLLENVSQQMEEKADMEYESSVMGMQAQQEAMLNPPVPPEEPPASPAPATTKTDAIPEFVEAGGFRIKVSHKAGVCVAGFPVFPNGQRLDDASTPSLVIGPAHQRSTPLYQIMWKSGDDTLIEGPYVTGFAMKRQIKRAVTQLYSGRIVGGMRDISAADSELLRAGWENY